MTSKVTEHVLKYAEIELSPEDIRGLDTFLELIPSPGAGKFNQITEVVTVTKAGDTPYGAAPIKIVYGDASGIDAMKYSFHWGVLNASHDKITAANGLLEGDGYEIDGGFDTIADKSIGIYTDSAPSASGNGTIKFLITYKEHTLL